MADDLTFLMGKFPAVRRAEAARFDQVLVDEIHVLRLTVGGEAHDLVLARVDLEARVVGDGGVEQTGGIGPPQLTREVQLRTLADARRGSGPLADTIHRENCRFLERRREERTRRV